MKYTTITTKKWKAGDIYICIDEVSRDEKLQEFQSVGILVRKIWMYNFPCLQVMEVKKEKR